MLYTYHNKNMLNIICPIIQILIYYSKKVI